MVIGIFRIKNRNSRRWRQQRVGCRVNYVEDVERREMDKERSRQESDERLIPSVRRPIKNQRPG